MATKSDFDVELLFFDLHKLTVRMIRDKKNIHIKTSSTEYLKKYLHNIRQEQTFC